MKKIYIILIMILVLISLILFFYPKEDKSGSSVDFKIGIIEATHCKCLGFEKKYTAFDAEWNYCYGILHSCLSSQKCYLETKSTDYISFNSSSIEINQHTTSTASLIISNPTDTKINIKAQSLSDGVGVNCSFLDSNNEISNNYKIEPGSRVEIPFTIKDTRGNTRATRCVFGVEGVPLKENTAALMIKVIGNDSVTLPC